MADTPPNNGAPAGGIDPENESTLNTGPQAGSPAEPKFDHIGVIGHVGWLMTQSDDHKQLFVADLEWRVMPPIMLNQFRLWREGNVPVGFASWAMASERVEDRIKAGILRLSPADWASGTKPVLVDLITPFGGREKALEELGGIVEI